MSTVELEHPTFAPQHVGHQFEELEQQNDAYIVGIWIFLVTEIMFFGALFLALTIYRYNYATAFEEAHNALNWKLGMLNTFILLTSSFFMAMAVRAKTLDIRSQTKMWLGLTLLCAFGFLTVKYFEYSAEIREHHFPGPTFRWEAPSKADVEANTPLVQMSEAPKGIASLGNYTPQPIEHHAHQLFFSLYFIMTGLHGLHVLVGILVLGCLWVLIAVKHPAVEDYIPLEIGGIYWHFVDIVWIFLYPLVYLIGRQ
jgi:cytochrome c oxidase subunit 3